MFTTKKEPNGNEYIRDSSADGIVLVSPIMSDRSGPKFVHRKDLDITERKLRIEVLLLKKKFWKTRLLNEEIALSRNKLE